MTAEEDARARREAWLEAGAPDYAAPTRDEGGGITGYQSVAAQPIQQRSQGNWGLAEELARMVRSQQTQVQQGVTSLPPSSVRTTAVPGVTRAAPITWNYGVPQAAQGLSAGGRGPTDYGTLSEIAARAFSVGLNITIEQARDEIGKLENQGEKDRLIRLAETGALNYLAPEIYPQGQGQVGAGGQTPGVGRTSPMTQDEWNRNEYYATLQRGAYEQAQMDKAKAEQDLILARNADERARAQLAIQQATQRLTEARFEEEKNQYRGNMAQQLLGTAASLKGPRDYPAFMKYLSGGRGIVQQLYGNQPRPDFSAPTGPIQPMTIDYLMEQLGLSGNATPVAQANETLPLPHQISPAVWDSLGSVGQQLVLGLAEQAGWDANEFLRQLTAARPQGWAAPSTAYRYAAPTARY